MTNIPYPPPRPLSVGEILDLTFRIYRTTLVKCLVFAGLGLLAGQLPNLYSLARGRPLLRAASSTHDILAQFLDPGFWLAYVVALLVTLTLNAAVLLRQHRMVTGAGPGGELRAAFARLAALVGLSFLIGLSVIACFLPAAAFRGAVLGLAVFLLLIPASYVLISLSCANTVLLVENMGPIDSYQRSWRLTQGSYWRLSVIYTVALIILIVLYLVITAVAGLLAGILGRGDVALATATGAVVLVMLGALATPFYTSLALAVLGDLTVRKEGADLERRISAPA